MRLSFTNGEMGQKRLTRFSRNGMTDENAVGYRTISLPFPKICSRNRFPEIAESRRENGNYLARRLSVRVGLHRSGITTHPGK